MAGSTRGPASGPFGIPVQVEPTFFLTMLVVYSLSGGGRTGGYAVVALAILLFLHELGHALTARAFGCTAGITLTFFGGYAAYRPSRPLKAREQMAISLAGPVTQLAVAMATLAVLRPMVLDGSVNLLDLYQAVLWAGIYLGLLNLLPFFPLDGSRVVLTALDKVTTRATEAIQVVTWVATAVFGVLALLTRMDRQPDWLATQQQRSEIAPLFRSLREGVWYAIPESAKAMLVRLTTPGGWVFLALICVLPLMMARRTAAPVRMRVEPARRAPSLMGTAPAIRPGEAEAVQAETWGWSTGSPAPFPHGWGPSPWLRAHLALLAGDRGGAGAALRRVNVEGRERWVLPEPAFSATGPLLPLLPDDLGPGEPRPVRLLAEVLRRNGQPDRAAGLLADLFHATGDPQDLYATAGAIATAGDHDLAIQWLNRAVAHHPDPKRFEQGDFDPLRHRPDFQRLLSDARFASEP